MSIDEIANQLIELICLKVEIIDSNVCLSRLLSILCQIIRIVRLGQISVFNHIFAAEIDCFSLSWLDIDGVQQSCDSIEGNEILDVSLLAQSVDCDLKFLVLIQAAFCTVQCATTATEKAKGREK